MDLDMVRGVCSYIQLSFFALAFAFRNFAEVPFFFARVSRDLS